MLRALNQEQVEAEIHSAENRYFTAQNYGCEPTEELLVENYFRHNIAVHVMEFYVDEQLSLPFPNISDTERHIAVA